MFERRQLAEVWPSHGVKDDVAHPGRVTPQMPKQMSRSEQQTWSLRGSHPDVPICLEAFIKYYTSQNILREEDKEDRNALLSALQRPLPISFRVNQHRAFTRSAFRSVRQIEGLCGGIPNQCALMPSAIPGAYVTPKIDRSTLPESIRRALKRGTTSGTLSRQEIVSMVPVLMLDPIVQNQSICLDMCAAPGSKTTQLLEMSPAAVVANDFSLRRAGILTRRCRGRVPAEVAARLLVTNHAAQSIPEIASFDRIVCDVPCTGDGAIRKNQDLWRYWQPHLGIELHTRQLQIALRAASLLAVGGTMAYSTCSLNPIENEAVVAALLRQTHGALELVDVSDRLPKLKRRPGIQDWVVSDDALEPFADYDDAQRRLPKRARPRIRKSMFPPKVGGVTGDDENEALIRSLLPRCVRMYPHLQDTGGFFVAILRKKAEISVTHKSHRINKKRKRDEIRRPFSTNKPRLHRVARDTIIIAARSAGLHGEKLWASLGGQLFSWSQSCKRVFFLSDTLSDIYNKSSLRLRSVFAGVLLLEQDRVGGYKIAQEGLEICLDYVRPERLVLLESRNLQAFLYGQYRPIMSDKSDGLNFPLGTYVVKDPSSRRAVVARVAIEESFEEFSEFEGGSEKPVDKDAKIVESSMSQEDLIRLECRSQEALAMSSKQLMDSVYRKFKVRTKDLCKILGCSSVGVFLEEQRAQKCSAEGGSNIVTPKRQEKKRCLVYSRVLRPCASWIDRQSVQAKVFD